MTRWLGTIALALAIGGSAAFAQAPRLMKGKVYSLSASGEKVAEKKLTVTFELTGNSDDTNDLGIFMLPLPPAYRAGEPVKLAINKPGWRIPNDGNVRVPFDLEKDLAEVELVPSRPEEFWSEARVEDLIKTVAEKSVQQAPAKGEEEKVDFSRYIKDWAEKYGFSAQQAKEEIDKWIAEVEAAPNNDKQLGLAEFAKKNFGEAARHFEASATQKAALLAETRRQQQALAEKEAKLTQEIIEEQRLAGDSYFNDNQFEKALAAYQSAQQLVDKAKALQQWANLMLNIGNANWALGIRTEGDNIQAYLQAALQAYQQAGEIWPRESNPEGWATVQMSLGNLFYQQGTRVGGEEEMRLLTQAVTAYENALKVYTLAQSPENWAMTQNNLGTAYSKLGNLAVGKEGVVLLSQAITAYENALKVFTHEQLPQDWAMTQNNLGTVYRDLGMRTSAEERTMLLRRAVTAYENALVVYAHKLPENWAGVQTNLGNVYVNLGTHIEGEEGKKLLEAAMRAYENALMVYTRKKLPQNWAMIQNSLGTLYRNLGMRTGGDVGMKFILKSLSVLKLSLEVRTLEHLPGDWAHSQNNLALTYIHIEDWFNVAVCYTNVLKIYPRYEKAYETASYLYQEVLFKFRKAFALNQNWLAQFPNDLSTQCHFAEKHFTTSRFAACEQRLTGLLANAEVSTSTKIALRAIGIANALAQNKTQQVPAELETLQTAIAAQPDTFKVDWPFEGTKQFITTNETLAQHCAWLLQFFTAIEREEGREAILAELEEVRKNFSAAK